MLFGTLAALAATALATHAEYQPLDIDWTTVSTTTADVYRGNGFWWGGATPDGSNPFGPFLDPHACPDFMYCLKPNVRFSDPLASRSS